MISISLDVSIKIRAFINEIRFSVPYELLPLLVTLELQANAMEIDEGLITEIIVLLSINRPSIEQHSKCDFVKDDKAKLENSYNNLIILLNDIQAQERVINSNRIRR
jgi:hypothetical protein